MNLKYMLGAILSVPLLPVMFFQGRKIKASVPSLPEAKGVSGSCLVAGSDQTALNIITLGESTIAGVGVETHATGFSGAFAKELSELTGISNTWKVYAKSGYTAKMVTEKIVPKINEPKVDLIVIGLGANDAFTLNTPWKWRKHINELIAALRNKYPETLIVFCQMPPIKEFPAFTPLIKFTVGNLVEILGQALKKLVNTYDQVLYVNQVLVLDEWIERLEINADRADFFSDGVHPSQLTYQTWAKEVAKYVARSEGLNLNPHKD